MNKLRNNKQNNHHGRGSVDSLPPNLYFGNLTLPWWSDRLSPFSVTVYHLDHRPLHKPGEHSRNNFIWCGHLSISSKCATICFGQSWRNICSPPLCTRLCVLRNCLLWSASLVHHVLCVAAFRKWYLYQKRLRNKRGRYLFLHFPVWAVVKFSSAVYISFQVLKTLP